MVLSQAVIIIIIIIIAIKISSRMHGWHHASIWPTQYFNASKDSIIFRQIKVMHFYYHCFVILFLHDTIRPIPNFSFSYFFGDKFLNLLGLYNCYICIRQKTIFYEWVNFIHQGKGIYNQFNELQKHHASVKHQNKSKTSGITNNTRTKTTNNKDRQKESPCLLKIACKL